jgi:SOS-response transcriptional repressor LexA
VARPAGKKPLAEKRKELNFTEDEFNELKQHVEKIPGVKFASWVKTVALEAARKAENTMQDFAPVPVFGYICAGDGMTVTHLPPGTTAHPPFALRPECYGLMVVGDSMSRDYGLSIPDGSYAFFCPDIMPHHGAVVHVEFPLSSGEHECTLKRYCPNPNGTVTFEPFNKSHKPITKKEGEFVIRGIFVRAWDGNLLQ